MNPIRILRCAPHARNWRPLVVVATSLLVANVRAADADAALASPAPPRTDGALSVAAPAQDFERMFWTAVQELESSDAKILEQGREQLRAAAEGEFVLAQYYMGECLLHGWSGFKADEKRSIAWFRLAAERGYAPAKAYLGVCLGTGTGTPKDAVEAVSFLEAAIADAPEFQPTPPPAWFFEQQEKAAGPPPSRSGPTFWETAFALAHYVLGMLLDDSDRPVEALSHFEIAAAFGPNARASVNDAGRRAAMAYALGRGAKRDLPRANALLAQSRDLARTQRLASFRNLWSRQVVDDFDLSQFEKASATAADEMLQAGMRDVAEALIKDNPAEAVQWCTLAAESGQTWAMIRVAELLLAPGSDAKARAQAFAWYRKAAEEKDDGFAWGCLAACHLRGIGTPPDQARAFAIARPREHGNFLCALVTAKLTPEKDLTFANWRALLEATAKAGRVPAAQYFYVEGLLRLSKEELMRAKGLTTAKAVDEIQPMLERAAKRGSSDAMFLLGVALENVDGERSLSWYEKAEKAGSLHAALELAGRAAGSVGSTFLLGGPDPRDVAMLNRSVRAADTHFQRALEIDPQSADAHHELAVLYVKLALYKHPPADVEKNFARALKHLREADRLGLAQAAYDMGRLHEEGNLVSRDFSEAYGHYQRAADRGHTLANFRLGYMHDHGLGVPRTPKDALYYYRVAAADNDRASMREVVRFYRSGHGTLVDLDRALFWAKRLAGAGEESATVTVGDILLQKKDYAGALKFWEALHKDSKGLLRAAACDRLSQIFDNGLGVERNHNRAVALTNEALRGLNSEATCRFARHMFTKGDAATAVPHLSRIAPDSPEARYLLGTLHLTGNGVKRDETHAWELIRDAAENGIAEAQMHLAKATLSGETGAPSLEDALRYAEDAEASGENGAGELREKLEARRGAPPVEATAGTHSA